MDFSTIKNQMEAKDGTGYKNVRDTCAERSGSFFLPMLPKRRKDGKRRLKHSQICTACTRDFSCQNGSGPQVVSNEFDHQIIYGYLALFSFMRLIHISNSSEIPSSENAGKCQQKIKEIWGLP
ncbi:hypothetical protein V6N13_038234 [Hibiscus sabdariffa]|uniref:Uncharacterized protein n=1 Tax=Hibiscus sabdariffa TaxID=183260 RepID=A0ABR2S2J6_9ROSI